MGDLLSLPWTPGPLLISCTMCPQASPGVPFSFLLLPNFPGFSRSHENPSPSTPGTWDPHTIPVSGLSLPLPRLNPSVSLLWDLPAYSQLSNSFRILRVLQALLCTTWDTPLPKHTHTHTLALYQFLMPLIAYFRGIITHPGAPPRVPRTAPAPPSSRVPGSPEPLPLQHSQATQPVAAVYKDTRFLTVTRAASSPSPRSRRGARGPGSRDGQSELTSAAGTLGIKACGSG